jgi:hypothetical protein
MSESKNRTSEEIDHKRRRRNKLIGPLYFSMQQADGNRQLQYEWQATIEWMSDINNHHLYNEQSPWFPRSRYHGNT